ncbi:MAG: pentatricopeptide repeat-containing protein [bacterium]
MCVGQGGQDNMQPDAHKYTNTHPHSITYCSLISAYASVGDAEGARKVFDRMLVSYRMLYVLLMCLVQLTTGTVVSYRMLVSSLHRRP